ncbi:MAG: hypothetical protein F4X11_08260 [Acidobacteria bacterium]|nr:hypothetical protein [Acidobacteriota bacterium]
MSSIRSFVSSIRSFVSSIRSFVSSIRAFTSPMRALTSPTRAFRFAFVSSIRSFNPLAMIATKLTTTVIVAIPVPITETTIDRMSVIVYHYIMVSSGQNRRRR